MTTLTLTAKDLAAKLSAMRDQVQAIRQRARQLHQNGATGAQVAAALSEKLDELLVQLMQQELQQFPPETRAQLQAKSCLIAVGGTGRRELAPGSDVDLLFLYTNSAGGPFARLVTQVVQNGWDAHLELGHSVRTLNDAVAFSRKDAHFSTCVTEARLLWGSDELFEQFQQRVQQAIKSRRQSFLRDALLAREEERAAHGAAVSQLEPNVKKSPGGLRDIHLIRWIGCAWYGTTDLESLRLRNALQKEDARQLRDAQEFLMKLRHELHFQAGKAQDKLTRDEQLRISQLWDVPAAPGQRPVEAFMQTYFRHTSAVARISREFAERHQSKPLPERFRQFFTTHRADGIFRVSCDTIDVPPWNRAQLAGSLEMILQLYHSALLNQVDVAPELAEYLRQHIDEVPTTISDRAAELFLKILRRHGRLGRVLRSLFEIGVLQILVPETARTHCLLQFNQYHSYTVDEHTFRAVEAAERFYQQNSSLGKAYQVIANKELLHLALLLHDLGKGYEEDHSEVGRRIAIDVGGRLKLPAHKLESLVFLVHKHLRMSHLAFRRNYTDPKLLFEFAHEVGSPETLRMLFVLTASDLAAVGPDVFTDWKGEVLTDLYDRAMLILSGKHHQFHEEERVRRTRDHIFRVFADAERNPLANGRDDSWKDWVSEQVAQLPPHYITTTPPELIARDLTSIHRLKPGEIDVEGFFNKETGTIDFRILTHESLLSGCFHKIAGVLTANRTSIISADITTSLKDVILDRFRIVDHDFSGEVPPERIEDILNAIKRVLRNGFDPSEIYKKRTVFQKNRSRQPVSDLPPRVVLDNNSSSYCTVIDVFAHDRTGLLYAITRKIFELNLSVKIAKIATHLDQVMDVFYVTEKDGRKVHGADRFKEIHAALLEAIQPPPEVA